MWEYSGVNSRSGDSKRRFTKGDQFEIKDGKVVNLRNK